MAEISGIPEIRSPSTSPLAANHHWFTSIAYRTGFSHGVRSSDNGAMSASHSTVPSADRNAIDRGIRVFFIQKCRGSSFGYANSMP